MEGYLVSNKYTERFHVCLTYEQMSFLLNKAWDLNISMSKYIRSLIDREMEKGAPTDD